MSFGRESAVVRIGIEDGRSFGHGGDGDGE